VLLQSHQRDQTNFQDVNLVTAIDDTLRLYAKKARDAKVTLITSLDAEVIHVYGSPVQIRQMFSNLVANAIDAMPEGGTLEISLYWHQPDLYAMFADTGVGLPLDAPAFELFFSTKPTGHGIGLYTCRLIADAHRARITWGPNLPKGTIFTVKFPTS
jgi:signal transduction histidine kinase